MKLRNILVAGAMVGMMFASMNRTGVVGYTAGDYADMNTFAHKVAGQNVAWTTGDDFTAVWTADGTTWGFNGGDNQDLVNMWWSNGTYGLNVGMNMAPDPDGCTGDGCGEQSFGIAFGMGFMGYDVGFSTDTGSSDMSLNMRGACNFWAFDTFTFAYNALGADDDMGENATTNLTAGMYGTHDWGAATGMFGLSFTSDDDQQNWEVLVPGSCSDGVSSEEDCSGTWTADTYGWNNGGTTGTYNKSGYTAINTNFSVESTLTDWCDLRIGYGKSFNMADNSVMDNYAVGLGFSFGSVGLDMTLSDGTLDSMMSNPLHYVNGRNDAPLTTSWTLTYNW